MTEDAENPRPPRRAKPAPKPANPLPPSELPADDVYETQEVPTTWRPAPAPPPAGARRTPPPVPPVGSSREGENPRPRKTAKRPGMAGDNTATGFREPRQETGGPTWFERVVFGRISSGHLATFCRQFSSYLDAGVDLVRSLTSLQKQFARTALGPVLERLALAVRRGDALGDAMAREPQAFDPFFLSMIRVAEARGGTPETLRRMSSHYEARQRLIRQARSAMIYPAAVLLIATVVGGLLTIFVLPKLIDVLAEMLGKGAGDIPLPTLILMRVSGFIQTMGWWLLPIAMAGTLFGLVQMYRNPKGKAILDRLSLYVPVLGLLRRKIDTTRFARTLSALLSAGVDYDASLRLTSDVLDLSPMRSAVRHARSAVLEGTELSVALEGSRAFTPDVIAIIETGEETGKLPETLERLGDDYEEQVAHMVKNLGSLIQPIFLLVIGGIVFFIVLAFIMAYVNVIARLAGGG